MVIADRPVVFAVPFHYSAAVFFELDNTRCGGTVAVSEGVAMAEGLSAWKNKLRETLASGWMRE